MTFAGDMESHSNTNWGQSVTGVVIRDGRVLLTRHTYGRGKGKLIIPGGYVNNGESPQQALKREFLEETGIEVEPEELIGVRFNTRDWYIAFRARYVSGTARSDHNENSEVLWVGVSDALERDDVPYLSKLLIKSALSAEKGLTLDTSYESPANNPSSLYCLRGEKNQ